MGCGQCRIANLTPPATMCLETQRVMDTESRVPQEEKADERLSLVARSGELGNVISNRIAGTSALARRKPLGEKMV